MACGSSMPFCRVISTQEEGGAAPLAVLHMTHTEAATMRAAEAGVVDRVHVASLPSVRGRLNSWDLGFCGDSRMLLCHRRAGVYTQSGKLWITNDDHLLRKDGNVATGVDLRCRDSIKCLSSPRALERRTLVLPHVTSRSCRSHRPGFEATKHLKT